MHVCGQSCTFDREYAKSESEAKKNTHAKIIIFNTATSTVCCVCVYVADNYFELIFAINVVCCTAPAPAVAIADAITNILPPYPMLPLETDITTFKTLHTLPIPPLYFSHTIFILIPCSSFFWPVMIKTHLHLHKLLLQRALALSFLRTHTHCHTFGCCCL